MKHVIKWSAQKKVFYFMTKFFYFFSFADTDREFDPSAETLVSEYDDERTLDEEEAMSGGSGSNELSALQKVCKS